MRLFPMTATRWKNERPWDWLGGFLTGLIAGLMLAGVVV